MISKMVLKLIKKSPPRDDLESKLWHSVIDRRPGLETKNFRPLQYVGYGSPKNYRTYLLANHIKIASLPRRPEFL